MYIDIYAKNLQKKKHFTLDFRSNAIYIKIHISDFGKQSKITRGFWLINFLKHFYIFKIFLFEN